MSQDVDIIVHHFHTGTCPTSPSDLLDGAHRLVEAATATSRWRSINVPQESAALNFGSGSASYVWARAPPQIVCETTDARLPDLEEWDASFEETVDVLDTSALPEFENTTLDDVLRPKSHTEKRKSRSRSRSLSLSRDFLNDVGVNNLDSHHSKRRRSCSPSPHIPISTLIPLPHYYESPDPACPPPPEIERIPAFRIARGILMILPYARAAWLVPLRGRPPFDGASSAILCSSLSKPPPLPPESNFPICIQWTPEAVSQFWMFLLRQRSMNNFGPLALSYAFGSIHQNDHTDQQRKNPGENIQKAQTAEELSQWEYVKIYHDGKFALKIRSLLDSFRWEDEAFTSDASRANRILKGARLVLVDERGGVMLLA